MSSAWNAARSRQSPRAAKVALAVSIAVFVVVGLAMSRSMPTWSEEVSVHATYAAHVIVDDSGRPRTLPACGDADASRWLRSPSRPVLVMCTGHIRWPVMVAGYTSGVPYWVLAIAWPLYGGDIFALRGVGLAIGALSIFVAWAVARRFADDASAAYVSLAASVVSAFVFPHSFALYYESMPAVALAGAALLLAPPRGESVDEEPTVCFTRSRRRILAAGALVGIAWLGNVKTLLLVAPIFLLWLIVRIRTREPRLHRGLLWAVPPMIVVSSPMWLFAAFDPERGASAQVSMRWSYLLRHLQPWRFARETGNLLTFWSDVGYYGDQAAGLEAYAPIATRVAAALALAYCTAALLHTLGRPREMNLVAACGALLWTYVAVSTLIYEQFPSANYAPLAIVFAVGTGLLPAFVHRRVAPLAGAAFAIVFFATFAHATIRRLRTLPDYPLSINADAVRSTAEFLRSSASAPVLTTTYNHADVINSLGRGDLDVVQVQHYLQSRCQDVRLSEVACTQSHWSELLGAGPRTPWYVVVPAERSPIDEPGVKWVEPALLAAAREGGYGAQLVHSGRTHVGREVIRVWRVDTPAMTTEK
jgi:hypothetical protein